MTAVRRKRLSTLPIDDSSTFTPSLARAGALRARASGLNSELGRVAGRNTRALPVKEGIRVGRSKAAR